jgi:hypothetical protein
LVKRWKNCAAEVENHPVGAPHRVVSAGVSRPLRGQAPVLYLNSACLWHLGATGTTPLSVLTFRKSVRVVKDTDRYGRIWAGSLDVNAEVVSCGAV